MIEKLENLARRMWLRWSVRKITSNRTTHLAKDLSGILATAEEIALTEDQFEERVLYEIRTLATLKFYTKNATIFIDAGANVGMTAVAARYYFDESVSIYMIEPSIACSSILKGISMRYLNMHYENFGLGAEDSKKEFNRSLSSVTSQASSFLEFTDFYKRTQDHANSKVIKEEVTLRRLDNFLIEKLGSDNKSLTKENIVLHVDVEGYEFEVLRGADSLLDKISVIVVEVSNKLFIGGKGLPDIMNLLDSTHELLCAAGNPMMSEEGEVLVQDFVFVNKKIHDR
jgi:FkbM family methyltransferase